MGCCGSTDERQEAASFERTEPILDFDCKVSSAAFFPGLVAGVPGPRNLQIFSVLEFLAYFCCFVNRQK